MMEHAAKRALIQKLKAAAKRRDLSIQDISVGEQPDAGNVMVSCMVAGDILTATVALPIDGQRQFDLVADMLGQMDSVQI